MAEGGKSRVLVLGAGSWGTTLAILLARNGFATTLWGHTQAHVREMANTRRNERYLPGVELPDSLEVVADLYTAAQDIEFAVFAVPTQFVRSVATVLEDTLEGTLPIVTASKGLEVETFRTPCQILTDVLGERPMCVLTGPSHAEEVARGLPCSMIAGSADLQFGREVQRAFSSETFRVYTSPDAYGAELAGALKNVIALAAGICDGLELGDNAKSALMTRGVVEMARFGRARGAQAETFFGLAGIGDLATTCFSRHSRNRAVGEQIGRGKTLRQVLDDMKMVAEGVWTTQALFGPEADLAGVAMPIAREVHAVLFEGKPAREAVSDLMTREPVDEMHGLWEAAE